MKVLISGAQFSNKGAQSLLFTVMDQLLKHKTDTVIYFAPLDDYRLYDESKFRFKVVYYGWQSLQFEKGGIQRIKVVVKQAVKKLFNMDYVPFKDYRLLNDILPELDLWIDISGYQLGSNWSIDINKKFLNYIILANKYNTPIVLLPQSFGPFNYGDVQYEMEKKLKTILPKADLIFAREREGYELLRKYGVENVRLSTDLVLQDKEINWKNIWIDKPKLIYPILKTSHNVGIVPNFMTFKHGNKQIILETYRLIINKLLDLKKEVYIFRHSADLKICEEIYELVSSSKNVHLISDDMNCLEYGLFVKQFDYIIASRYHAIVHAYKECVPSIILGWAIKYQELCELFEQSEYVFNITDSELDNRKEILRAIDYMDLNYISEKSLIHAHLATIQENNCFDQCWSILNLKNDTY